jgi:hypothetical protein
MKEQNEHYTGNKQQINFKLSLEERQIIHEMASTTGLSLSEYCRIKCLMNEDVFIRQQKQITDLEMEVKELKVKSSCFKNSNVDSNDIVLNLNKEQRDLLNRIYGEASKFYGGYSLKDNVKNNLSYNILYFLLISPIKCLSIAEGLHLKEENCEHDEDGNIIFPEPEYNNLLDVIGDKDYDYWRDLIDEVFAEYIVY